MSSDEEFDSTGADVSLTQPVQASALRVGHFALLKGKPCKVIKMTTSKTGKHGHAKVHFTGTDILTGKKVEDIESSTHNMKAPVVKRTEYMLLSIDDGFYSLLDEETGETKEDVGLPPESELGEKIQAASEDGKQVMISVIDVMGTEQVVDFRIEDS